MSIKVIRPGLLASIQDLGRYGFQKYGVIVSGAMDSYALRIANLLIGNQEGEAAIEVTLMGTSLQFEEDSLIAITGGNLSPKIEGEAVPLWRPVLIKKGSILQFTASQSGCRAYVTVAGGFDIPQIMESKSTYLRGGIGGFKGRSLQAGDVLPFQEKTKASAPLFARLKQNLKNRSFGSVEWYVPAGHVMNTSERVIRVIKGMEFDKFSSSSREQFFEQEFQITPQSDRMGYRLSGPELQLEQPFELLSEAVAEGTIQVPKDGNPIILLADRQTTGGYPRIAQISSVDLPVVAQLKPGEKIRFKEITREESERLYLKREQDIEEIKTGLSLKKWSL
ncbi:5-oxoprolinase subunit C family protein [Domibacillus epiphyticus]|uniref:KipI antagonist n=1 Tax=Domibacillus epiphyticus TaxID=1714355 RepID=A0A1V2AAX1_9BACI|nr:biotin-dependent carboxyltransferase family protein [Domibacillus epiphyticus]OMP68100.1 KipI antagonist [Domibacillus epiphyticus]